MKELELLDDEKIHVVIARKLDAGERNENIIADELVKAFYLTLKEAHELIKLFPSM